MQSFIPKWASHGNEIYGDFELRDSLFLIVGADEQKSPTSGCSIDTLNRAVKQVGDDLKIDFFNRLMIAYHDSLEAIQIVSLGEFKDLLRTGKVDLSTLVYNNLIETKSDLETKWKVRVNESWHKNLLVTI